MGAVTGKGLADLIRERFGVRWTAVVMLALLIANGGVTVSEFVGIAAATELFGEDRYFVCADFTDYGRCQREVDAVFRDPERCRRFPSGGLSLRVHINELSARSF